MAVKLFCFDTSAADAVLIARTVNPTNFLNKRWNVPSSSLLSRPNGIIQSMPIAWR